MTIPQLLKLSKWTAFISFLLGTCIFLIYYFTSNFYLLFVGFAYIFLAVIFNLIILVLLFIRAFVDKNNRNKVLRTSIVMLLNIPILIFYCYITRILINTMRIEFINLTEAQLNNIVITGCDQKHIDKLSPGEAKTVWIYIPTDCRIDIYYYLHGQKKSENVIEYCGQASGRRLFYQIGKDKRIDKDLY